MMTSLFKAQEGELGDRGQHAPQPNADEWELTIYDSTQEESKNSAMKQEEMT